MVGYGVMKTVGEVRGDGGGRSWMLRVRWIAVEDVGWTGV